ncbi:MAG: hypothetical protein WBA28_08210 [Microbacteriaceae bacterium]
MFEELRPKKSRRVRTKPAPGSDPEPGKNASLGSEDELEGHSESAAQKRKSLKSWYQSQKPPHWG